VLAVHKEEKMKESKETKGAGKLKAPMFICKRRSKTVTV
jgi:hypothetical protein